MPVSTRSHITSHGQNEPNPEHRTRTRADQEDDIFKTLPLRNPHHGLKEKMRALTVLYEQQKQASASLRSSSSFRKEDTKPKPDNVMRENTMFNSTITRTYVLPQPPSEDAKENMVSGTDRIVGFSTTVARKLSMGSMDRRENEGTQTVRESEKMEVVSEKAGKSGNRILVFVRLRPMAKKEKEAGSRCCVRVVKRRDVYLTECANENDYLRLNRLRGRHFTFDASFPESATQQEVYSTTTSELVEAVLQGRNGSVFCYGATGAGKTYTMLGTVENPGVMVLAIKDLFSKIRQRSCDGNHVVHLSYLEVYNEHVRDLLSPGRPLVLREDKQGIVAAGLTQYRAYSTDEVMALLQQGNQNRTTEPTRANETSSRSHAILQVVVEYKVRDGAMNMTNRVGKLSLIDLAGSERALATDQRTVRSLEGANINRSLLALSSCINALVEDKKHIPYRNSKLTQLLKDSLGGTCNTVMIANISPSNLSFGETQNTLHWADRAKEIRPKACDANEDFSALPEKETDQAKLILELQKENRELRTQLARHQQKLMTLQAHSLAATPPPSASATSTFTPPTCSNGAKQRKPRTSLLPKTCFTPDSKKIGGTEVDVRALQRTVRALEAEMERMKKEHCLKMKQKDDLIRELSQKKGCKEAEVVGTVRTRTKEANSIESKMASPSHRFRSPAPAPAAKKRSFWDIAGANSPSVTTLNGRKTRSHAVSEASAPPSMLLQPGFARQKANI